MSSSDDSRDDRRYAALKARDPRFDGVFFVGVTTTGIYCRPVCVARTPGRDRCQFFDEAVQAEKAGFRACFRCRPEAAPGLAPIDARSRMVRAALARVDAGFLNEGSVETLAAALGVTARHLRRTVSDEVGASLVEIAQSRRIAMARRLLADSRLSTAEIAFASGFRSVRRFNALFAQRFGRAPSRFRPRGAARAKAGAPVAEASLVLRLPFRPPFHWRDLLAFLGARAIAGVEAVSDDIYRRTARFGDDVGIIQVSMDPRGASLRAAISTGLVDHLMKIVVRLRALFDLDARPDLVGQHLAGDASLSRFVRDLPGLRLPGAFEPFEASVRAILGQQISVRAAATLVGRLVARFGKPFAPVGDAPLTHTFPTARELAAVGVPALASLGLPATRAATLQSLAELFTSAEFLRAFETGERAEVTRRLKEVRGIGDWTAEYVAMRALHDPDAFPAGDLGILKALGGMTPKAASLRAEAWRPWRAYAVMHLWSSLGVQQDSSPPSIAIASANEREAI
ncbi:MAG TPA: AlkA N-terminal domain-containing protein [Polyangia bacterium]